ncbi:hypothetical protein BD309DRAFT_683133 [Dichomitus squalens]|nr:hypothetical protein BD309DRAFT_683133 [Dichomitus squalens]TBU53747.1 hypothetical protein BD310DRAFT_133199 [Dichomitus squalens]
MAEHEALEGSRVGASMLLMIHPAWRGFALPVYTPNRDREASSVLDRSFTLQVYSEHAERRVTYWRMR